MRTLLLLMISMVTAARGASAEDTRCVLERAAMVETIRTYARSHASGLGQQGLSETVLEAMGQTQRHLFIPERSCTIAYADMPLPIGAGQTISQPFVVALMTQLANIAPDAVVLEVGTGFRAIRPRSLRAWRERSAPSRLSRSWPRPQPKNSRISRMTT